MSKTILITGGAGFIGSHLTKKLSGLGHKVIIVDGLGSHMAKLKKDRLTKFLQPSEYALYDIDLSDPNEAKKIFKKNKVDVICHLAAKTNLEFDSFLYNQANILSTINIFEIAKNFKIPKVVFASSSMVYGSNNKPSFNEEDNSDHPLSIYAASKKSAEILAYTYHHLYKIEMVGLRFFTTYGPWGRPETSISKFTKNILEKKTIEIQNFGKIKKDFTYVDDIVKGIVSAIENKFTFELINLGSGKNVGLEKIIKLIEKNLGIKAKKKYIGLHLGDQVETCANIKKAKKLLDYKPDITIEEGIRRYIDWYKGYY